MSESGVWKVCPARHTNPLDVVVCSDVCRKQTGSGQGDLRQPAETHLAKERQARQMCEPCISAPL